MGNSAHLCRLGLFQDSDLLEILIQNRLQRDFCTNLDVTRLCQYSGSARSNYQLHIVQRNLKLILLIQVTHEWNSHFWTLWFDEWRDSCLPHHKNQRESTRKLHTWSIIKQTNFQILYSIQHNDLELGSLKYVSSNVNSCQFDAILCIFEDNDAEVKLLMSEVHQWDMYPKSTELRLTRYLTESIWIWKFKLNMLTSNINSQTYWQKTISSMMSGTVCSIWVTSVTSAQFDAFRISVLSASQKRWRKRCIKE